MAAIPLNEQNAFDALVIRMSIERGRQRHALNKAFKVKSDMLEAQDVCPVALTGVESKWRSTLHSSPVATMRWMKLDVNTIEVDRIGQLRAYMKACEQIVVAVETRGGYRIIVE